MNKSYIAWVIRIRHEVYWNDIKGQPGPIFLATFYAEKSMAIDVACDVSTMSNEYKMLSVKKVVLEVREENENKRDN